MYVEGGKTINMPNDCFKHQQANNTTCEDNFAQQQHTTFCTKSVVSIVYYSNEITMGKNACTCE